MGLTMEEHIQKGTVKAFKTQLQAKLNEFTAIETSVSRVTELKMKALILDLIHNIEVADLLLTNKCDSLTMWPWQGGWQGTTRILCQCRCL